MRIIYTHRPAHLYDAVVLRATLAPSSGRAKGTAIEEVYVTRAELEAFATPRARLLYLRARYRRLRVLVLRCAAEQAPPAYVSPVQHMFGDAR